MGALRFFLATMVLISHMGITLWGLNPGVVAVVIFYLLAGQVVTRLLHKWQDQPVIWSRFYRDRLWRIGPQYLAAMTFAAIIWAAGADSTFISASPSVADWLANLLIVPLSYYMYSGQDAFTLVPPAWSLGVELQFYLLAPFVVFSSFRLLILMTASLAVFIAAQAQWLNTDYFGYRLLPGVLFIFLLGACQARQPSTAPLWRSAGIGVSLMWLMVVAYLVWLLAIDRHVAYDREVAAGLLFGIPMLALLRQRINRPRGAAVQRSLGGLSYGVFLFHFPVIWAMEGVRPESMLIHIATVLALTTCLAAVGHWGIERPLWRRYRPFGTEPSSRPAKAGLA